MAEQRQLSKDITIGETRFRLYKLTGRNGSWIIGQIMNKALPMVVEAALRGAITDTPGGPAVNLPHNRAELTEAEFHNLQDHLLKRVARLELQPGSNVDAPMPLMTEEGTWVIADLEYETSTILTLTIHALLFNVLDFFEGDALKFVLASFRGLSLFNASK